MATYDDARRFALALPEVEEGTTYGNVALKVKGKLFAWQRPLRKRDREELGDAAPDGDVFAVRVEHEVAKRAVLESEPAAFTTAHFEGHPSVLLELGRIGAEELEELVVDAWLCAAPQKLADAFVSERSPRS